MYILKNLLQKIIRACMIDASVMKNAFSFSTSLEHNTYQVLFEVAFATCFISFLCIAQYICCSIISMAFRYWFPGSWFFLIKWGLAEVWGFASNIEFRF